ncbi:MAG: enoyl-CoA hydratase/isomerase family protein [Bacteroidetes bacterium]|nr:enoyl-CoA hydratase/isomerase family protein [Bacteroidota bacterium]
MNKLQDIKSYKTISWEVFENIGHLQLNQPPTNKMTIFFFEELTDFVQNFLPTQKIEALIISGKGRHFSSGADLNNLLSAIKEQNEISESASLELLNKNMDTLNALFNLKIPVIAAISGVCLGSALELALFCHVRICDTSSLLGLPEAIFNLMPGLGGAVRITQLKNKAKAMELILSGENFSAKEAKEWGIIDIVAPKKKSLETAIKFAKTYAKIYKKENLKRYIVSFQN